MAKLSDENDLLNLHVQVTGEEDFNEICFMLRGLFAANRNSNGQARSNEQLRRGTDVLFGTGPMAGLFIEKVEKLFRRRIRDRIELRRH